MNTTSTWLLFLFYHPPHQKRSELCLVCEYSHLEVVSHLTELLGQAVKRFLPNKQEVHFL